MRTISTQYIYTISTQHVHPPGYEHHGLAELQHLLQHQRQRGVGRGGGGAEPGVWEEQTVSLENIHPGNKQASKWRLFPPRCDCVHTSMSTSGGWRAAEQSDNCSPFVNLCYSATAVSGTCCTLGIEAAVSGTCCTMGIEAAVSGTCCTMGVARRSDRSAQQTA